MSRSDPVVSYESSRNDATIIRPHPVTARQPLRSKTSLPNNLRSASGDASYAVNGHARQDVDGATVPVSNEYAYLQREEDTGFQYHVNPEKYGWKPGQVPLFLEWYPEKLDRRSHLKFFESGKEYLMGRSPACDFFFPNSEPDSKISGQHLKLKVLSASGHR